MTCGPLTLTFTSAQLEDYIDWTYFFYAWGLPAFAAEAAKIHNCTACRQAWIEAQARPSDREAARQALQLCDDARRRLHSGDFEARARFALLPAAAEGDDIFVGDVRLPMLRQQKPQKGEDYCRCLADYIGGNDARYRTIGVFVATAGRKSAATPANPAETADDYARMLADTTADRLAEAAAERMHEEVRRKYWGYAPDERLSPADLFAGRYTGLRPAVGYPSLPDQSLVFALDRLIGFAEAGVSLTESGMMRPHASVCGLMLAHPAARHFAVGPIGADQLTDYARRRGASEEYLRRFLKTAIH